MLSQSSKLPEEVFSSSGLPNLGNTCYLNSALQQIYRIEAIHNLLNELINKKDEDLFVKKLYKLFSAIKDDDYKRKKILLATLFEILAQKFEGYTKGQRNNSLQAFMNILNLLIDRKKQFYQQFAIKFTQKCKCIYQKFQQMIITNNFRFCSQCQSPIEQNFWKFPNYLIVVFGKYNQSDQLIKKLNCKEFQYRLQSKNIYIGGESWGHYYAQCQYNQKMYIFNDRLVYSSYEAKRNCCFAIYKKCMIQSIKGYSFEECQIIQSTVPSQAKNFHSHVKKIQRKQLQKNDENQWKRRTNKHS